MRKMPIHGMVHWAPLFDKMILFSEDLRKKEQVGLVCPMNKIDDALTPTSDALPTPWKTQMWIQVENSGRRRSRGTFLSSQHFEG